MAAPTAAAWGADSGRVDLAEYERSVDYLTLRRRLLAGGQSEQVVAMADILSRVRSDENLAGSYQYILQLSELVAGSPYFGPLTQFGPESAPRRARETAVAVLGEVGDLATARFLARLLSVERDSTMQALILEALGALGAPVDEEVAARLGQIVRNDVARGPNDRLGLAIADMITAVDEYRGGYLHPDVVDVLFAIAQANYSRSVRQHALDTLRSLAGGNAP